MQCMGYIHGVHYVMFYILTGPGACNSCAIVRMDKFGNFSSCLSKEGDEKCPSGYYRGIYDKKVNSKLFIISFYVPPS